MLPESDSDEAGSEDSGIDPRDGKDQPETAIQIASARGDGDFDYGWLPQAWKLPGESNRCQQE